MKVLLFASTNFEELIGDDLSRKYQTNALILNVRVNLRTHLQHALL